MMELLLFLSVCFVIGALGRLIDVVIAPDWLDWAEFAGFSMLWPLSLHCSIAIPALVFTALAFIADAISYFRAKKSGGETRKPLRRLWLTPLVALLGFALAALVEMIGHMG